MPESSKKTNEDTLYQSLWAEALAVKQANAEFESALESLVESVKNEVLPVEINLGHLLKQVLYKQLTFSNRRALSELHRKELHVWIEENVRSIKGMGLADEELLEKTALAHAKYKKIPLDSQSKLSISDQVDQYYFDLESRRVDTVSRSVQDGMANANRNKTVLEFDNQAEYLRKDEFNLEEMSQGKPELTELDDTVFQQIFRKTASALHPDKEPDSELREKKQRLMSVLLESRKNYDLITMLELHTEFVSDPPDLSSDDKRSLTTVLYYFIQQMKIAADAPIYQSNIHVSTYRRFYASNGTTWRAKLRAHVERTKAQEKSFSYFVNNVNTIFKLSVVLDDRLGKNVKPGSTRLASMTNANCRDHRGKYDSKIAGGLNE